VYYEKYWSEGFGDWHPSRVGLLHEEVVLLADFVPRGAVVVDVGCGDGRMGRALHALGISNRYTGVEISAEAVKRARESGLLALVWDGESAMPVSAGAADVVLCFEVLEHVLWPELLLAEVHRVLRDGGRLIGSVPNVAFWPNRVWLLLGVFNPGGSPATALRAPWRDPHVRFFTPKTVRRLLEETGFGKVLLRPQRFRLTDLPVLYRVRRRRVLLVFSSLLGWLAHFWPSAWSPRVFFVAEKTKKERHRGREAGSDGAME
jgi:SAM-dependent methyltransferase